MMSTSSQRPLRGASAAYIRAEYEVGDQSYEGRLIRVTFDGVLLAAATPPPVGTAISAVLMRSDRAGVLRLPATVSWSRTGTFSAHWKALGPRQIRALDGFLLALARAALGVHEHDEEPLS